jgi:translin
MKEARGIVDELKKSVEPDPEIYYSGYTQDAIKEFVEAHLTINMIQDKPLALPEELCVEYAPYMNGLAETIGELRRRCLDILRHGYSDDAERLLDLMDEIYSLLVTVDYPDAITHGLRRQTDLVRGIIERTRADLTTSLGEQRLQQSLKDFEDRITRNEQG